MINDERTVYLDKQTQYEADYLYEMRHSGLTWEHWAIIIAVNAVLYFVLSTIYQAGASSVTCGG